MSYFDAMFAKAFPPDKPFPAYSFPKMIRNVTTQSLETSILNPETPGQRSPFDARAVKTQAVGMGPGGGADGAVGSLAGMEVNTQGLATSAGIAENAGVTPVVVQHRVFPMVSVMALFPQRQVMENTVRISDHSPMTGQAAKGAKTGRREHDPYGDFNFIIEIGDLKLGAFQKIDGLDVEIDQIEYKDSMDPYPRKRPGIHRYGNIKLTKGVVNSSLIWDWCNRVMQGDIDRQNGTIHVIPDNGDKSKPEMSYHFYAAWPCKWSGLKVDGKGTTTLVEELELCVDSFVRA